MAEILMQILMISSLLTIFSFSFGIRTFDFIFSKDKRKKKIYSHSRFGTITMLAMWSLSWSTR